MLDAAHVQNEAGRDAFVALAHTALFAASVSFVGDVAPLNEALWKPALICGWLADVVGLIALTVSFGAARRAIDARRATLNDAIPKHSRSAEILNAVALWSFPTALVFLFSFVTVNVVYADGKRLKPAAADARLFPEGHHLSAACADLRRWPTDTGDRCDPRTSSTLPAPALSGPSAQERVTKDNGR